MRKHSYSYVAGYHAAMARIFTGRNPDFTPSIADKEEHKGAMKEYYAGVRSAARSNEDSPCACGSSSCCFNG
jgi:hypothetical protein